MKMFDKKNNKVLICPVVTKEIVNTILPLFQSKFFADKFAELCLLRNKRKKKSTMNGSYDKEKNQHE